MTSPAQPRLTSDDEVSDSAVRRPLRQWIVLGLIVALVSTACVIAGRWQWNRHVERSDYAGLVTSNYDAEPVTLDSVVIGADGASTIPPGEVWRQVQVSGSYVEDGTVILRSRPVMSQHVFHILVPFMTDDGEVLVVNRGTVPMADNTAAPAHVPAPPEGDIVLTANLRANEPATDLGAPDGQVRAINVSQVLNESPMDWPDADQALNFYAQMRSESPTATESISPLPRPSTDVGSHLSYAWQWLIFAFGVWAAFIALIVRERRDLKFAAAEAGESSQAPEGTSERVAPPTRRRRERDAAEAEEDELVAAQMGSDEETLTGW